MGNKSNHPEQDPAEGSRRIIERELKREDKGRDDGGGSERKEKEQADKAENPTER